MAKRAAKAEGEAAPKLRRGRPKGLPKTGGRKPIKEQVLPAIHKFVIDGLSGQPVKSAGPTGKPVTVPLTQDNQVKLAVAAWKKYEADLNATAIKADVVTEDVTPQKHDRRQVARSILSLLQSAKLDEAPEVPAPPPPVTQKLLTRDPVIEINSAAIH